MAFDRRETILLLVGDFCILVASLWSALLLRNLSVPPLGYFEANLVPFLPMFLISLIVFYIAGLYEKQTRPIQRVMGVRIFGAQAATVAIAAILFFILPLSIAPKTILVLYLAVSVLAVSAWRSFRMTRGAGEGNRVPAVLVGNSPAILELFDEVQGNDRLLIRFISRIDGVDQEKDEVIANIASAGASDARILVADLSDPWVRDCLPKWRSLMPGEVLIKDFAALYEEIFDRVPLEHLDTAQMLETLSKRHMFYDGVKRVFDIVLALVGAVIAVPLVGIAAVLLSLENGAPFLYHERIGKNGHTFRITKLRSMLFDDHGNPELQKKNRVTALGRFLRKTRVDELSQLWNVLKGELSFIGPRPELPKIAEVYEREIPQYWMRHLITPGLSGWAQIRDYDAPRGGADVERTRRKLSFDLYYLKHRSFGLDLAIAMKTLRALLAFSGT